MEVNAEKKIHHLARYFGVAAIICFIGYHMGLARFFLIFLGPPFYLTYLLRVRAGFLVQVIPNQPLFNNLFLFLPMTFIYFGLVGFQIKNILNETGKLRILILVAFLVFLCYIHFIAFHEISLYLAGSEKLA